MNIFVSLVCMYSKKKTVRVLFDVS